MRMTLEHCIRSWSFILGLMRLQSATYAVRLPKPNVIHAKCVK